MSDVEPSVVDLLALSNRQRLEDGYETLTWEHLAQVMDVVGAAMAAVRSHPSSAPEVNRAMQLAIAELLDRAGVA